MYKSKLQELCQRKSWNLPEYSTIKDGPDHLPRFKAIAAVNGLIFETPAVCKSAKEAQNSVAKLAYDHFNISTPPRGQQSPSALVQPVVPACSSPLAPMPQNVEPVPVSPLPSALPLPPPGTWSICVLILIIWVTAVVDWPLQNILLIRAFRSYIPFNSIQPRDLPFFSFASIYLKMSSI